MNRYGAVATSRWVAAWAAKDLIRVGSCVVCIWTDEYPIPVAEPAVRADFGVMQPHERGQVAQALATSGFDDPERELDRRLAQGDRCFPVRVGGRIALQSWISTSSHNPEELWDMRLQPGEARLFDSFAFPQSRGKKLLPANIAYLMRTLRSEGRHALFTSIGGDNVSSIRACSVCFPVQRRYRFVMLRGMRRPRILGVERSHQPRLEVEERELSRLSVSNLALGTSAVPAVHGPRQP